MAKMIGWAFGLASLLYYLLGILNSWQGLSFGAKVVFLFVPSIFLTIAILAVTAIAGILAQRLYHHVSGTQIKNEFDFLESKAATVLIMPVWLSIGLGLYNIIENIFG
ncbi:hypothetical protein NP856_20865 [Pseudomonas sp. 17391]|uniref:hypothetical protein n=1 Tax=Pseudomonas sp. 17391 TaxID=2967217 RepID=UPI002363B275|nr:hypothetical protein [Pseudomonas sp. 17391]MDD2131605.1 hypothetical protein [Pseudomonas sp. 17391]